MNKRTATTTSLLVLVCLGSAAALTYRYWLPPVREYFGSMQSESERVKNGEILSDESAGRSSNRLREAVPSESNDPDNSLFLSPEAQQNIGLTTAVVKPQDFTRTVAVPAVVVERPGHSQIEITSPMTGIINDIFIQEGLSKQPGDNLLSLRLTHEDVVAAQRDFLRFLQERDVIQREIDRLKKIGTDIIPERRVIEQQYQYDKVEASIKALQQSLVLHGLTSEQVETIARTRDVLKEISIQAPEHEKGVRPQEVQPVYHVQQIAVNRGQSVNAGQKLGTLADHSLLFVEGQAFEEDAKRLIQAMNSGQKLTVVPVSGKSGQASDLKLLFVADHVEQNSRALNFYLLLPNQRVDRSGDVSNVSAFLSWKFRPGQRMEIQLPTDETWQDQLVLPPEAVAVEGPNAFVFEDHGDHFDQLEVRVLYRDKNRVVIEDDGTLAGKHLAMSGAYEMHLALKNRSGDGVDAHHGHSH